MSGAKGKSNYAYVGICRPFFNNKTSFVSIPLNIVLYVVLFRLFAKRLKYWGMSVSYTHLTLPTTPYV